MPIYEYECRRCGGVTSRLEKRNRSGFKLALRRCRHCGSWRLRRIMSGFSITVRRDAGETLEELKRSGPVEFAPSPPRIQGPPPGGCPYMNDAGADRGAGKE